MRLGRFLGAILLALVSCASPTVSQPPAPSVGAVDRAEDLIQEIDSLRGGPTPTPPACATSGDGVCTPGEPD